MNKDTAWLEFPNKILAEDSIDIKIHYFFREFDTINSKERQTLFYFTNKNISYDSIKEAVETGNVKRMKDMGIIGFDLTGKHDKTFQYQFEKGGRQYFTGFINDSDFFILNSNNEELGEIRYHQTYINREIKVKE